MGFWFAYMGIYGGGGTAPATAPNEGWIANSRPTVFISTSRERVWIAKDKIS